MIQESFEKNNLLDSVFPEETVLVVEKILEKYGLAQTEEEEIEKIFTFEGVQKIDEAFEKSPGSKIAGIIREYAEEKISPKDIPSRLEKELNVSLEQAKEITKELEETLFVLIDVEKKKIKKEKDFSSEEPVFEKKDVSIKKPEPVQEENLSDKEEIKPKPVQKKDVYRESIK